MSIPSLPVPSQKNKLVVWLLAVFLGVVGAHNFYLGEKQEGIYHIVLLAVTFVLYILSGVVSILATIGYLVYLGNWGWGIFQAYKASQRPDVV